jgi:RimJ/RimL family protein N-acetyltransferase
MKIETKRLILREWKKDDSEGIIRNMNNLNVSKWLLVVPYPYTKKDAKGWITNNLKQQKKGDREKYSFVIELKEEKKLIGGIGIELEKFHGKASIGYWLGEKYWGRGYGTEALREILLLGFNKFKLRKIEAGVFAGNPSSGKLLEKFGFKKEGIKRQAYRCKSDNQIKDEIMYGLLKEEWKDKK